MQRTAFLFSTRSRWAVGLFLMVFTVTSLAQKQSEQPTVTLAPAEAARQGKALVAELLAQKPGQNITNFGVMKIRDGKSRRLQVPIRFETITNGSGWVTSYSSGGTSNFVSLSVTFQPGKANRYEWVDRRGLQPQVLAGNATMIPFLNSDFWVADLGLEFLHWPEQRLVKKEMTRSRFCNVLESINPQPTPGAYSRVVSWMDSDSGAVVKADAYDSAGKLLKYFNPTKVEKVGGQWQLKEMEMDNDQTGSSTIINFDLGSP